MRPAAVAQPDFLAERVAEFYAQNSRATAVNASLLLLALWALAAGTPLAQRLAWAAAVLASHALRLGCAALRRRDPRADAHALAWGWAASATLAATGLAWGLGAVLLIPPGDAVAEVFWSLALCGIAAGVVAGAPYFVPAQWAYLLPLLLPLVVHHALLGGPVAGAVAGGLALFLVFCLAQGWAQARSLRESLRIRALNAQLLADLQARRAEAEAARAAAEAAAQDKARFFAAASHDLRQPMQALVLLDAALQSAPPAERPALQAQLREGIAALDRLFESILAVSRLDAGAPVAREAVHLPVLARRLVQRLAPQAQARGLALHWRASRHLPPALGDAAAIERLLGNLLLNALQHTPAGTVLLALRMAPGGVRLQVRDSGVGIAPAQQARVFDEFWQGHNPHRDRAAGSGLGLAIARRLALAMGGTLALRSAPGRGSCFTLRLPAAPAGTAAPADAAADAAADVEAPPHSAAARSAPAAAAPGADTLAGLPIWLLDDDPLVRQALAALLAGWGLQVQAAASRAGLPLDTTTRAPSLLLCDRMLAGDDGLAAADAIVASLQARLGQAPAVVLLSGVADPDGRAEAARRGWPWLDKPVRPLALRAALAAASRGIVAPR